MIYSVDFSRHDGSFCDEKKIFFKFLRSLESFVSFLSILLLKSKKELILMIRISVSLY